MVWKHSIVSQEVSFFFEAAILFELYFFGECKALNPSDLPRYDHAFLPRRNAIGTPAV